MKQRLGIFVAGFRWSGSGAVSDWMAGRAALRQAPNSEASFGEIRAINYGLRNSLLAAEAPRLFGERLGRHALCPDSSLKRQVLGDPLSASRGVLVGTALNLADFVFTSGARFRIIPGMRMYEHLLNHQLGKNFREDEEYLAVVRRFQETLRASISGARARIKLSEHPDIVAAATDLVALFYDRLSGEDHIPIFDNAFSGLYPRLFDIISPERFPKQIIVLVKRDPRDQFAELVKYSGGTFPFMVGSFIKTYAQRIDRVKDFIKNAEGSPHRNVHLIDFESFVLDTNGVRSRLDNELNAALAEFGLDSRPAEQKFFPERSAKNIGVWKKSFWARELARVARELPEYLRPEAD